MSSTSAAIAGAAAGDGGRDGRVPRVHQLDQLERRAQVEIGARRVPRFRAELVEGGHGLAVYADNRRLVNTIFGFSRQKSARSSQVVEAWS